MLEGIRLLSRKEKMQTKSLPYLPTHVDLFATSYSVVLFFFFVLGVTGLSRKEKRKYEEQKVQALGGKVRQSNC